MINLAGRSRFPRRGLPVVVRLIKIRGRPPQEGLIIRLEGRLREWQLEDGAGRGSPDVCVFIIGGRPPGLPPPNPVVLAEYEALPVGTAPRAFMDAVVVARSEEDIEVLSKAVIGWGRNLEPLRPDP